MTEKEMFLNSYEREFEITLKFLKAYPMEKLDFRPYPNAQSAKELAWSFAEEERALISGSLGGDIVFKQDIVPETFDDIKTIYERNHHLFAEKIGNLSDDAFNEMVTFGADSDNAVAPMRRGDVLWLALMDGAHHRGQFSVYIRMVGGKTPPSYNKNSSDSEFFIYARNKIS